MEGEITDLGSTVAFNDCIEGIEYHSHFPYASTKLLRGDEIRILVQHQDIFTLPSKSFLYFEGRFLKEDGSGVPTTAKLTNNALAYLFDEIRYELCGVEVDRVRNLGVTSTLKGMISFTGGSTMEHVGWCCPTSDSLGIVSDDGYFNVCLPLYQLLGFAEDYQKIIVNVKQELILIRSRSDENSYVSKRGSSAHSEKARIELTKLYWKLPYVSVNEFTRLTLLRRLKSEKVVSVAFRSWELFVYPLLPSTQRQVWAVKTSNQMEKPRYIVLAFSSDRINNLEKDASQFDHCNISNVKVYLNSKCYPYDDLNVDFERNRFAILYYMYNNFQNSYYPGRYPTEPLLSLKNFKEKAPLIVIDCSKQSESIKSGPVDVRLEFDASKAFPAETTAFCLIIHDNLVEYNPLTSILRKRI